MANDIRRNMQLNKPTHFDLKLFIKIFQKISTFVSDITQKDFMSSPLKRQSD